MPEKRLYYKREFLNREGHNGLAAILADVGDPGKQNYFDATLTISDCSRNISLEFWYDEEDGSVDNSLEKIDIIIKTLREFKSAYKKAAAKALRNQARNKKKKDVDTRS